ncbi:hypothetical protein [Eleftheria terrae]|uniref:hypothetical protein n=1 Tax=Eleftheria terrae TaxID=1597781 RepID=UPI00263B6F20|nr:hypothetical protein [Eleftheria terrae]WKB56019.1 hypothetical protein N7L95_28540 [Eleftheria terrae]
MSEEKSIKQHSVAAIEAAIGKALTELVGVEHKVTIQNIDLSSLNTSAAPAVPVSLVIRPAPDFSAPF